MYRIEEMKIEQEERDNEINRLKWQEELWWKMEREDAKKREYDEKKR